MAAMQIAVAEHDPEKWKPVCASRPFGSEKIMLHKKDGSDSTSLN
jgi:hypothetical protein